MLQELFFNDTYTGPRFTYGLTYRPVDAGQIPDGWIIWSDKPHKSYPSFGTIDYPFELSKSQIKSFGLELAK